MGIFDRMPEDPTPFRDEAARCRDIAERSASSDDRRLMLRLARENDERAMLIEVVLTARARSQR